MVLYANYYIVTIKPLHFVADRDQNKIVRVLISAGADVKSRKAESS